MSSPLSPKPVQFTSFFFLLDFFPYSIALIQMKTHFQVGHSLNVDYFGSQWAVSRPALQVRGNVLFALFVWLAKTIVESYLEEQKKSIWYDLHSISHLSIWLKKLQQAPPYLLTTPTLDQSILTLIQNNVGAVYTYRDDKRRCGLHTYTYPCTRPHLIVQTEQKEGLDCSLYQNGNHFLLSLFVLISSCSGGSRQCKKGQRMGVFVVVFAQDVMIWIV